ncbi:extracellular tyrosine-protein kinase PKDCC [Polypterus senegalus]|uniref:extracellular tyrosine-protein kinase PKDCC n=1 Tax=Polypterus senegalus TaxID=55291 RepID=UPI0019661C02|nr:extracellular tyrosine-protein kinase PKDCC [Polypterus senegalus]
MHGRGALLSAAAVSALILLVSYVSRDSGRAQTDNRDSQPSALRLEIRRRHKELLPFYNDQDEEAPGVVDKFARTLEHLDDWNIRALGASVALLGCDDLRYITLFESLGSGYTKAVLRGALPNGAAIAIKSVNGQGIDMQRCLDDFGDLEGCYRLVSYKLIKEILLLQRLQHPSMIRLKGHCYRREPDMRVMAVLELGSPLEMIPLLQTPWEERFRICISLVRLLHYLAHSPHGSVGLLDFQPRQFVLVDGELKLTDIDDATIEERMCSSDRDCILEFPTKNFSVYCDVTRRCQGLNEKRNLYNAFRYFFTYLLPHRSPSAFQTRLEKIMNQTGNLNIGINETLEAFEEILYLYKSGQYLHKLVLSSLKDYSVHKGFRVKDDGEYRCWPSYDHQRCLLSVHNEAEAAEMCSSRQQCVGFTLTPQRTWTGRHLVSFHSDVDKLIPDVSFSVYVRKPVSSGPGLQ